jgi:hypothetical protein
MPDILPPLTFGPNQSKLPPPGHVLLITDQLESSAEFLLHRALSLRLKHSKGGRCILVSTTQDYGHWKAVAARSNLALENYIKSESFVFIDATTRLALPLITRHLATDHPGQTCPHMSHKATGFEAH